MAVHIVFSAVLLALASYYGYSFVQKFRASAATTTWGRLIDAGHGSMTIAVQRLVAIAACLCDVVPLLADVLGASGVAGAVQGILPTGLVPYYMVAISLLTELARRRPGGGTVVAGN